MGDERDIAFSPISAPDEPTRLAAEARYEELATPSGSLGRLETLGAWIAACQGRCPPRSPRRPRLVLFAGDHGVAARGVSAYPAEATGQMVANVLAGNAAVNVLAEAAGVTIRVVDMAVDGAVSAPEEVTAYKARSGCEPIDRADALTDEQVRAAVAAGRDIADREVDAGADLLVPGDIGVGNSTPAAVLIAALTGSEPVAVVGRGSGIDDAGWMRKVVVIRDGLRRASRVASDPVALLRTSAGADIAAMTAFLAQAAVRKTPVVLDGVVSAAAALVAEELAPGARRWWVAGHRCAEPAHELALGHLGLAPLVDLTMRLGSGCGGVAAVPLLDMAARVLADTATFAEAGITGPTVPVRDR